MNKFDAFVIALARFIDNPKVAQVYDRVIMSYVRSYVDAVDDGPAALAQAVVAWARGGPKPQWFTHLDM